uniref:SFRICE_025797 n=1 Tax=Spodoptera frugiperda TaxID=7108 RepID=A0A2H1WD48_SPOFR
MKLAVLVLFLVTSTVSGRTHGHSRHGGGSHSYPHSTGYSGYGSGGSHAYPHSTGLSGNSNSGNVRQTYTQQHNVNHNSYSARTEVHHHYHYNPPQQISYGSTYHPVYQGHPPIYVYEYRDSGSRFDNLLTGLALYNLGRSSAMHHHYDADRQYSGSPGEICKLGISKRTGEYEETRINCNLMSSFILEDVSSPPRNDQQQQHVVKNTTQVQVTQTVNGTGNSSVTTVTVTSNTVEDALKVKGPSITVTPGMTCYMIRIFRDSSFRKPVDCGLLQEYARSSLHRNSNIRLVPHIILLFNFVIIYLVRYN